VVYGGWALLLGNVPEDALGHWFVRLYESAERPEMVARGWQFWRRPTWENPQITAADLEEAGETLVLWRREVVEREVYA